MGNLEFNKILVIFIRISVIIEVMSLVIKYHIPNLVNFYHLYDKEVQLSLISSTGA